MEFADYYLSAQHRSHQLTSYGTFDLPFGANGFIFRNATGVFKKAIEGWQLSWIASLTSGVPGSLTGASHMWGNSNVDLVSPEGSWDNKAGRLPGQRVQGTASSLATNMCKWRIHSAPLLRRIARFRVKPSGGLQALALSE